MCGGFSAVEEKDLGVVFVFVLLGGGGVGSDVSDGGGGVGWR